VSRLLATGAALLAVVLFAVAALLMTGQNLRAAGALFLSAALVIYIRETYLVD
jgi:hypothetical protein